jgi:diguanylate cyclase (GGDEF)-like protein
MGSFKLKLVLWFALLAFLPLAVAFYGYDTLAKRSETRRVDAGLESALRAAVAGYAAKLDAATRVAEQVASDPAVQRALRAHDRAAPTRLARAPGVAIDAPGIHAGNAAHGVAAVRRVTVLDRGRTLGSVSVRVPVDAPLLDSISGGLAPGDALVAVRAGRVIAGTGAGQPVSRKYRTLLTPSLAEPPGVAFAALSPKAAIDVVVRRSETRILTALLASLVIFGVVIYLLGRSIVGTLRGLADVANAVARGQLGERVQVRGRDEFAQLGIAFNRMTAQLESRLEELETERSRMRDATARFGEALVATHDPGQLIPIIVQSAVEATGAFGGVVLGLDGEAARAGDPDAGGERIAFPLRVGASDFGSLVLTADSFDTDQVETAASLAAQAVVALENARLHRMVERQAMVDSLTGLANRRSLEETLRAELARAARFGAEVCLVLADLDDFKQVNDLHGHPAGDEVLKEFARALTETVRESDVAARWGGEEFALVLTGTDALGGARLAERARAAIQSRPLRMPNGETVAVTGSFGVASYPEYRELSDLVVAADSALYAAKREGKNRVVVSPESTISEIV